MEGAWIFFILFALIVIGGAILAHQAAKKRSAALLVWATENGLRFDLGRDPGLEHRFPLHKCLQEGSKRYAENVMEGDRDGRGICAFDYHYETYSTNSKGHRQTHHHWFSAVVVDSGLPLKSLSIRNETFLDRFTEFVGLDDIDFELTEFSNEFYVKAPERRWAFEVLHQGLHRAHPRLPGRAAPAVVDAPEHFSALGVHQRQDRWPFTGASQPEKVEGGHAHTGRPRPQRQALDAAHPHAEPGERAGPPGDRTPGQGSRLEAQLREGASHRGEQPA